MISLPRASITPWLHTARLPFLNYKDSLIMTTPAVGILYIAFALTKKRAVATSYVKTYRDILFSCGFDCHEVSFTHVDTC